MTDAVYIDTSAFYALMDRSDRHHDQAGHIWPDLVENEKSLHTSNYVVVETTALLQNRLGLEAANLWYQNVLGIVDILWVDRAVHQAAYELWLGLRRRKLSLVDCVSFAIMRRYNMQTVFGFDGHFSEQGFILA